MLYSLSLAMIAPFISGNLFSDGVPYLDKMVHLVSTKHLYFCYTAGVKPLEIEESLAIDGECR